jgi:hypothetical protein
VFFYYSDRFKKPNPFQADVVVAIDSVVEKKIAALERMESQFYEGGANGGPELMPGDPAGQEKRRAAVRTAFRNRDRDAARMYRDKLRELYGPDRGDKVDLAEAFEVCEYGRRPNAAELRRLFPFFDNK